MPDVRVLQRIRSRKTGLYPLTGSGNYPAHGFLSWIFTGLRRGHYYPGRQHGQTSPGPAKTCLQRPDGSCGPCCIPPAIVRNDTIAFNAGAFPTRPNATVEDLLRKLPGIEIDKNGNVTMQGQKVDKIYLDGKEFFLNDPGPPPRTCPPISSTR